MSKSPKFSPKLSPRVSKVSPRNKSPKSIKNSPKNSPKSMNVKNSPKNSSGNSPRNQKNGDSTNKEAGNPRRNFFVDMQIVQEVFKIPELDLSKTVKLPSYDDLNYRVFEKNGKKSWVVKGQHAEFVSVEHMRLQTDIMDYMKSTDIVKAPTPIKKHENYMEKHDDKYVYFDKKNKALLHLITFVDNSELYPEHNQKSTPFLNLLGEIVGKVQLGMKGFFLQASSKSSEEVEESSRLVKARRLVKAAVFNWDWSTREIPNQIEKRLHMCKEERGDIERLLKKIKDILPLEEKFDMLELERKWNALSGGMPNPFSLQYAHTDLNDTNILFSKLDYENEDYQCAAVLDFGDSGLDYGVLDVGITAGYACMHQEKKAVDEIVAEIVRGYAKTLGWDLKQLVSVSEAIQDATGNSEVPAKRQKVGDSNFPKNAHSDATNGDADGESAAAAKIREIHGKMIESWRREAPKGGSPKAGAKKIDGCKGNIFDIFLAQVVGITLGRQMLSFIMGKEQMFLDPTDEYVAHTVAPVLAAARKQLHGTITDMVEKIKARLQD